MQTAFAKYEGAGNDFILIDNREGGFTPRAELIAALCDRHFGIGADGLMTLARNAEIDCSMRYYNADGSEGEMCGNGARCFALFVEHLGIGGETKFFDAADGLHTARIRRLKGTSGEIELGMIAVREIRTGDGWWFLNTGVPHYVEFVDDLEAVDVTGRGRAIRRDTARFPQGTNVNFVQVTGDGTIRVRTYERGVENETLACGTGATASAIAAAVRTGSPCRDYRVDVEGGTLRVAFEPDGKGGFTRIELTGPARKVFEGEFANDFRRDGEPEFQKKS